MASGAAPVRGRATADNVTIGRVSVDSPGRRVGFGLELSGVSFEADDDGAVRATVARAMIRDLQVTAGARVVRSRPIELIDVAVTVQVAQRHSFALKVAQALPGVTESTAAVIQPHLVDGIVVPDEGIQVAVAVNVA